MATSRTLKNVAATAIDSQGAQLANLSSQIWSRPELNYEEHFAHQCLCDYLESCGFQVERHFVVETAFRATFQISNGDTPTQGNRVPNTLDGSTALYDVRVAVQHFNLDTCLTFW